MFEGSVFILGYQNEVTISDLKIELPIQIYQVINSFSLIESQKVKIDDLIIVSGKVINFMDHPYIVSSTLSHNILFTILKC